MPIALPSRAVGEPLQRGRESLERDEGVLASLGGQRVVDFGATIGCGPPSKPESWIGSQVTGEGFRESHIAFAAPIARR